MSAWRNLEVGLFRAKLKDHNIAFPIDISVAEELIADRDKMIGVIGKMKKDINIVIGFIKGLREEYITEGIRDTIVDDLNEIITEEV